MVFSKTQKSYIVFFPSIFFPLPGRKQFNCFLSFLSPTLSLFSFLSFSFLFFPFLFRSFFFFKALQLLPKVSNYMLMLLFLQETLTHSLHLLFLLVCDTILKSFLGYDLEIHIFLRLYF